MFLADGLMVFAVAANNAPPDDLSCDAVMSPTPSLDGLKLANFVKSKETENAYARKECKMRKALHAACHD